MSEQFPSNNDEAPREIIDKLPDWGTQPERSEAENTSQNFIDYADLIIEQAKEVEPAETLEGIHALIRGVESAAEEGRIVTSRGDTLKSDDINHILDDYLNWANTTSDKRDPQSPLNKLTRKGGLRGAFEDLAKEEHTAAILMDALTQKRYERDKVELPVPQGDNLRSLMGAEQARHLVAAESELEPGEREKIEAELAEEALENTVQDPEETYGVEDEKQDSPWSQEAAQKRRNEHLPGTKENPIEIGMEDVQFVTSVVIDGRPVRASTTGYYFDEQGVQQMILSPANANDAKLFEGKVITKPLSEIVSTHSSDKLSKHLEDRHASQLQEEVNRLKKEPISDNDTSGHAMSMDEFRKLMNDRSESSSTEEKISLTKDEYLEKLTDGLTDEDKDSLKKYADTVLMVEGARGRGEFDNVAVWKKDLEDITRTLSSQARAIADQYARAYLHY